MEAFRAKRPILGSMYTKRSIAFRRTDQGICKYRPSCSTGIRANVVCPITHSSSPVLMERFVESLNSKMASSKHVSTTFLSRMGWGSHHTNFTITG